MGNQKVSLKSSAGQLIDTSSRVFKTQQNQVDKYKNLEMRNLHVLSNRVSIALQNRMNALNTYFIKSNSMSPKSIAESKSNSMLSSPSRNQEK